MANIIKQKRAALVTVTTSGLSGLVTGSTWHTAKITDNSDYPGAKIYIALANQTAVGASGGYAEVWLLQNDADSTELRDDAWAGTEGTSDLTIRTNSTQLGQITWLASAGTHTPVMGIFETRRAIETLGTNWGISIVNRSGVTFETTTTTLIIVKYQYTYSEVQ
jgi:hypothetical protein